MANKIDKIFRYSLMMYEIKRKIGDIINIHIGDIIPFTIPPETADLKGIINFLLPKTYSLDLINKHH